MSMWMILRIRPSSIGICYPIWSRPRDQVFIESSRLRCANSGVTMSTCHKGAQVSAEKENSCSQPVDQEDLRHLKAHSKARTPVVEVAKAMKRTEGAVRQKAKTIGIGLGHRR